MLSIFSKSYGKMFLLAKGVRRPKSRKRGHIEIFSRVKYSFTKNDHFVLMNEVELIDSYSGIRGNLKKTALAYYMVELISKILEEDEKHDDVYEVLLKYFRVLEKYGKLKKLRWSFIYEILVTLGYWPLDRKMDDPDRIVESVLERQINSKRVGEKLFN